MSETVSNNSAQKHDEDVSKDSTPDSIKCTSGHSDTNVLLPLTPFVLIIGAVLIVLMALIDTTIILGDSVHPYRSAILIDGLILMASLAVLGIVFAIRKGTTFAIVALILLAALAVLCCCGLCFFHS